MSRDGGGVVYAFRRLWFTDVRLQLWFYRYPDATGTAVEISTDGQHYRLVERNRDYRGDWLDVSRAVRRARKFYVRLSSEYPAGDAAGGELLVLDRLRLVMAR